MKGNIHSGHRERLINTVYEGNFSSLSVYQQVEYLLFYVFPRGDVNPLAHRLVDHFGSFSAILDADVDDLCQVKGMGPTSSKKLVNLLKVFDNYTDCKINRRLKILTAKDLNELFEEMLRLKDEEETVLVGLNKNWECIGVRRIAHGDDSSVIISPRKIYHFIDTFKPDIIVVAHNHPGGRCSASYGDVDSFDRLEKVVNSYGCGLLDSYIVGVDGIYSTKNSRVEHQFNYQNKSCNSVKNIFKNT